jgi:hypothetical protein
MIQIAVALFLISLVVNFVLINKNNELQCDLEEQEIERVMKKNATPISNWVKDIIENLKSED